jgi:AcrR family transcriptional regulator
MIWLYCIMHPLPTVISGPKLKLLEVAERLLAEKDFSAISIRDITQVAKMNVAAVNYHFGSREGLLARVIERYGLPICQQRLTQLDSLEKKASVKPMTLDGLIEAWVLPVSNAIQAGDSHTAKLLGQIFALESASLTDTIRSENQLLKNRYLRAFSKLLPSLKADDLALRLHWMEGGLIHLLRGHASLATAVGIEAALGDFIAFSAAGVSMGTDEKMEFAGEKLPQELFDFS